MADNLNGQQPSTSGFNPLNNLPGGNTTQHTLEESLSIIANALQTNPNAFNSLGLGKRAPVESQSNYIDNKWKFTQESTKEQHSQPKYNNSGNIFDDFNAGIKEQMLDALAGGDFKKGLQSAMDTFSKEFGMDIRDVPREMGKKFTKQALSAFGNSDTGKALKNQAKKFGNQALDSIFKNNEGAKQSIRNVVGSFRNGGQGGLSAPGQGVGNAFTDMAGKAGGKVGGALAKVGGKVASSGVGKAVGGLATKAMSTVASMGPYGAIIAAVAVVAAKVIGKIFGPLFKGIGEMANALKKSFNKDAELRKKRLEEAKTRLKDDVNYLVEQPFKILEEAANKWADTWDANLAKIGQTQGYDKESVYALYESYAERLRQDNLGNIINATDIVDKLSSVLDSGLSGEAAEEFAYIATKLNAAIPTQDFFGYVDTYASIAANAISQGKSQSEALADANQQLEDFASNLLYSSRELAGGFSTGLKNSSNLFKEATQIAQSAKTYNATAISGTLTSVSAIIGAVAPDLADSLVSNIVQAAVGGNSSNLVALRSLAGVNAGNTEFLRAMAENPQAVFSTLFGNLASMQNMSSDNYMEVAEGLADIFGIDKAAFARVDFNYLATAINAMNTNSQTLEENLALLESGQTRTSAEQLKAQEINSIILDEGLAYVIDSEAGRAIQQHMWDEQRAVAMMEATYSVDLQGAALEFLEGIRKTISNILNFLNPIGFIAKGISNMVQTITESVGNEEDIKEVLMRGAVGSNTRAFNQLTTRGKDLDLVASSLVEMMGGTKGIGILNAVSDSFKLSSLLAGGSDTFNTLNDNANLMGTIFNPLGSAINMAQNLTSGLKQNNKITSRYNWNTVGKSVAQAIQNTPINTNSLGSVISASDSATKLAQESSNKRMEEFLATAEEAAKTMTYEQWVATAKNKGISDFSTALDDFGRTEAEIKDYFEKNETKAGAEKEAERKADEQLFRDQNREFWDYTSGTSGVFQSAIWFPFFGEGQKYDTRMNKVDDALSIIRNRIGTSEKHTVIGGIEEISRKLGDDSSFTVISVLGQIRSDIATTFVSSSSAFQRCLADWTRYISESATYTKTVSKSSAWTDLKNAEKDQQTEATLALANALGVFSADELKKMDPQLQANVLLGEILVILQTIMQQNNTQAGGLSLPDTLSALGFGMTFKTG